jgi:hypothetical protein
MNKGISYPYPVLSDVTGDYVESSSFSCEIQCELDPSNPEFLVIGLNWTLVDSDLRRYLESESVSLSVRVRCPATFFQKIILVPLGELEEGSVVRLQANNLDDVVHVEPRIMVNKEIEEFSSSGMDGIYAGAKFQLSKSDFVAEDHAYTFTISNDNIRLSKTIAVARDERLRGYEYKCNVGIDSNVIQIALGPKIYEAWAIKKKMNEDRHYFAMSIYKDCLVAALYILQDDIDVECAWAKALKRKLDATDSLDDWETTLTNGDFNDINRMAQELFTETGAKALVRNTGDSSQQIH